MSAIIKIGFLIFALLISKIHNEETENKAYDMDWFEIMNSPQEETDAEKTLKELCSNYDLVLFGRSIDCSKISIKIKTKQSYWDDFHYEPLIHVLHKRETNDLDLEEGSGNAEDLAEDKANLRSPSINKEESQDNNVEKITDQKPELIMKNSETPETDPANKKSDELMIDHELARKDPEDSEKLENFPKNNLENSTNKKSDEHPVQIDHPDESGKLIVNDELLGKKNSEEPEKLEKFPQKNVENSTIKKSDDVQSEKVVETEEFKKETKIQEENDQINKPDKIEERESENNVDKLKEDTSSYLNNSFAVASVNIDQNAKTNKAANSDPLAISSTIRNIETTTPQQIISSSAQDTDESKDISKLKEPEKIDEHQSANAELMMNKNPPLHHLSSIEGSDAEKTLDRLASRAQINAISSNSNNDAERENNTEKVTRKGDSTILIVLFVIVVVIGGAAFTHHIIQKKRKSRHQRKSAENLNNGVGKNNGDIEQGTEMKPLIKTNNDDPIDKK